MSKSKAAILSNCTKEIEFSKKLANNTVKVKYKDGSEAIRLHNTDIVTTLKNGKIVLDSGGWRTSTTKDRINSFSPARIWQDKGVWYLDGATFYDGIVIDKDGKIKSKRKQANISEILKVKKQISKFVNQLTKDNLPVPSSGDCWLCCLHTAEGKSMGDISKDNGHIEQHVKENYLHGSLLVNAMRERGYTDESIRLHYGMKLVDTFKRALRIYLQKRLIKNIAVK